jgi:CrcB protein
MKMIEFLLLAAGAVAGAYLRYAITASPKTFYGLPLNVLAVNVTGSFILGLFSVLALALNFDTKYSLMLAVGFCGSFTTMSSFALESSNLWDANRFSLMALNIFANVGFSLAAVMGGRAVGDVIMERLVR